MSKKKPPKTHFRKFNEAPVCGTTNPKALYVQKFGDATCKTCKTIYRDQRREGEVAIQKVVRIGALSEGEMMNILKTAIREEAVRLVMQG